MRKNYSLAYTSYLFMTFLLIYNTVSAQWYDPEKVNKKAGEIYSQAYDEATSGRNTEALAHIKEALSIDPKFVDAYLSRAGIYSNMKNYSAAIADFEMGIQMDSLYSKTFLLPYSISLAGAGKFRQALEAVNRFLTIEKLNEQSIRAAGYRKRSYEFALDYEKKHASGNYIFSPQNMGDSINTNALEYFPSLTIDGRKLIFTRRVDNDEDFYESNLINGKWSKAKPLGGKINTNFNEGAQNISQDGQLLIYTGCNYPEGQGSCDLYFSVRTNNGWSEPQNLGPLVNTDFWESSPSLSPDKRDLYFASSQLGGYGGKDIWVSHRLPSGKWGRPVNLGPTVNTDGDESCPFMHADNQTLYFNSNGHLGYGMTDLFLTRKLNDSTWSEPENLGYPINTIDDEGSLIIAADGKTAYYASERPDTRGGLDLYTFQMRPDIRPAKTLWVRGKVFDKKTLAGLPSAIELTEISTRRLISRLQTDEDGNYLITLPVGKEYAFNVNRKGYLFYSYNFSLLDPAADTSFVIDIPLQPIETGASVVLRNIFFDTKKSNLNPGSVTELDKVVQLLNENPKLKVLITGHTDNIGQPKDNIVLSNDRAKSVVNYLLTKGITASRLTYKGYGESKPIADNKTESGRALNRRTELSVVSN